MPVRAGRRSKLLRLTGVAANAASIRGIALDRGRFLSPLDVERAARVAVIGPDAADRLFDGRDPIGRSMWVDGLRFRVIGLMVAKGEQLLLAADVESDVLHRPTRTGIPCVAGVRHAQRALDLADLGRLDEGEIAGVVQLQEAVPGPLDPVHPVERDQLHAQHVAEELDLPLHVGGADREMMHSVRKTHASLLSRPAWATVGRPISGYIDRWGEEEVNGPTGCRFAEVGDLPRKG